MAIPWLTVLKSVPWSEAISNAPKLADGAKSLWKAVARKRPPATSAEPGGQPGALLQGRLAALEAAVSDLHGQMLASSELIQALADQNAQLILRIEANRRRLLWLSAATVVLALAALLGLYLRFAPPGA